MSTGDISLLVGWLISAWASGFCAGYIVTKYKDAMSQCG